MSKKHSVSTRRFSYLEGVVLCVESEDWNLHEFEFSDEARVVVVVLHVGVAELSGGETIVEFFDSFARQHRVQVPVAVEVVADLGTKITIEFKTLFITFTGHYLFDLESIMTFQCI